MSLSEQIQQFGAALKQKVKEKVEQKLDASLSDAKPPVPESASASSSALMQALMGPIAADEGFYFPPDLIGGTCPRIVGDEEEIVWNAAAEACDTERVHVVWQSFGNRIWYLAVRSADLASHMNTWCPLASLLPTEKDKLPVCYTYFGEDIAVLMVVTPEGLNVFRGTSPVVRAKAERTSRELENASIINLDPFRVEQLTPIPWYSLSLFEDRARRVLATVSVAASLVIMGLSFLVWISASMEMIAARHDLADALDRTQTKSMQLMREAETMRASPMRTQIEKFLSVNEGLLSLNGLLNVYEIRDKGVRWRAVVPISATADRISAIGGKNIQTTDHGVTIGNDAEIEYEAERGVK
ncbi:MAG: hypothetical protein WCD70_10845 [Alphaproteobacteria bacterium]